MARGHKGRLALVDRPAFHLHPLPSSLCLVVPHQTTPVCWGILVVYTAMKLSPADLRVEVVKREVLHPRMNIEVNNEHLMF